jgi:hypothetical protein
MSTRSRIPHLGAALVAASLLTACAPIAETTAPTPVADATLSASSTPSATSTPAGEVVLSDVFEVEVGEPFLDAAERTGAAQVQGCSWVARSEQDGYRLQFEGPEAPVTPDTGVDLVAVAAPVGNAAQGPIGPRTAEGIGIGSTVDEARVAFPDAQVSDAPDGPQRYLRVSTGEGNEALFLAYSEGTPVIWGMIATERPNPAIEPCG